MKNGLWPYPVLILGSSLLLTGCGGDAEGNDAVTGTDGPREALIYFR